MRMDERAVRMMRLLEYVNQQERPVPVSELVELARREFGVSEVTLRSDLSALTALRGVRKAARGSYETADAAAPSGQGSLFGTRLQHRSENKLAIAGAVAEILARQSDLRVLLLDAGTTTYYVADRLSEHAGMDLIVWTPSVVAASRLAGSRGVSVRLLGGEFQPDYAVVSGDETARALRALAGPEAAGLDDPLPQFPGTHCVLDVNYVSPAGRLYTDESKERLQKRLMADLAEEVTLVADHSKLFGRRLGLQAHEVYSVEQLAAKRAVRLVTDDAASEEERQGIRALLERAFPGQQVEEQVRESALIYSVQLR
jgi:DeoR/GlpR family transcriptional regulator of sugar metabolism